MFVFVCSYHTWLTAWLQSLSVLLTRCWKRWSTLYSQFHLFVLYCDWSCHSFTLFPLIKPVSEWRVTYLAQQLCAYAPIRPLRSSTSKLLQVPRTNLRFGSRSFYASAPTLWNLLPRSVRFCESLTTFRKHLKTFYFQSAFPGAPSDPLPQRLRFNFWHSSSSLFGEHHISA